MADEVADIRRRRYIELCKQQAAHGYSTEPSITLEILELREEFGAIEAIDRPPIAPDRRRNSDRDRWDIDFTIKTTGQALYRITRVEGQVKLILTAIYVLGALVLFNTIVIILSRFGVW